MTPKRERFCREVVAGKTQSEAYRIAFDAGAMKDATVHKRASELMSNGEVKGRIADLRGAAAEDAEFTLDKHLRNLLALRNAAVRDRKFSAAIQAEIARGKAAGFYVDRSEVTGRGGEPLSPSLTEFYEAVAAIQRGEKLDFDDMSDETLLAIARGNLAPPPGTGSH